MISLLCIIKDGLRRTRSEKIAAPGLFCLNHLQRVRRSQSHHARFYKAFLPVDPHRHGRTHAIVLIKINSQKHITG